MKLNKLALLAEAANPNNALPLLLQLMDKDEGVDPKLLYAARQLGDKIYVAGCSAEMDEDKPYLLSTFYVHKDGKSGHFGGTPDASFKTKKEALAALKLQESLNEAVSPAFKTAMAEVFPDLKPRTEGGLSFISLAKMGEATALQMLKNKGYRRVNKNMAGAIFLRKGELTVVISTSPSGKSITVSEPLTESAQQMTKAKTPKLVLESGDVGEAVDLWMDQNRVHNMEGTRGIRNFTKLVGAMGYSSLDDFLEDNPGCLEAMVEWIKSQRSTEWAEGLGLGEE